MLLKQSQPKVKIESPSSFNTGFCHSIWWLAIGVVKVTLSRFDPVRDVWMYIAPLVNDPQYVVDWPPEQLVEEVYPPHDLIFAECNLGPMEFQCFRSVARVQQNVTSNVPGRNLGLGAEVLLAISGSVSWMQRRAA